MNGIVHSPEGVVRAECEHCGPVCKRSLEEAVSIDKNRGIAEAVARNHKHRCPKSDDGWSETVPVDVAVTAETRGGGSGE